MTRSTDLLALEKRIVARNVIAVIGCLLAIWGSIGDCLDVIFGAGWTCSFPLPWRWLLGTTSFATATASYLFWGLETIAIGLCVLLVWLLPSRAPAHNPAVEK